MAHIYFHHFISQDNFSGHFEKEIGGTSEDKKIYFLSVANKHENLSQSFVHSIVRCLLRELAQLTQNNAEWFCERVVSLPLTETQERAIPLQLVSLFLIVS